MKFYADADLSVSKELHEHVAAQDTLLAVEAIVGHQFNEAKGTYEVKVSWKGLESIEDSWEDLSSVQKDVPRLLQAYAAESGDSDLQAMIGNGV